MESGFSGSSQPEATLGGCWKRVNLQTEAAASSKSRARGVRIVFNVEPQMALGPRARVVHADAGTFHDLEGFGFCRFGDVEVGAEEVVAVVAAVNLQGAAEQARLVVRAVRFFTGSRARNNTAVPWLFRFGHHIQAMVHAVDKINVGVAGRAEHGPGARGQAFGGV